MHDVTRVMRGTDANTVGSGDEPEAGYLDTPEGALFAIYYPPRGATAPADAPRGATARAHAVLLCDAFGSDRMNLHILYRVLAERLAAAGFAVLRVDYAGTCDSSGYPRDCAQVSLWRKNLARAADYLKARSGAQALCAYGAALGGTLALALSLERDDVSHLALWSALGSGRVFLREAAALDALSPASRTRRNPTDFREGDREATGFLLSADTVAELSSLDALKLEPSRTSTLEHALLYGAGRIDTKIAERLRALGTHVEIDPIAAALNVDVLQKTGTRPPAGVVETMVSWLERLSPALDAERTQPVSSARPLMPSVVLCDPEGRPVREEVVRFGRSPRMLGLVTEPAEGRAHKQPIVLVNGGLNHRCGINRNYTEWARRFAAQGHSVLRFDIRGLGDSLPDRDEDLGVLYRDETVNDVREALSFLCARTGASSCLSAGLCAGGYQSLQAALIDPRVSAIVMMNPLRFRPITSTLLLSGGRESDPGAFDRYAKTVRDPGAWRRAFSDSGSIRRLAERLMLAAETRARAMFSRSSAPPKGASWLASTFLELCERGCDVRLVLDDRDPIVQTIEERLSEDRERLEATGRFSIDFISDTDHIFRPLVSQQEVLALLMRYVHAREGAGSQVSSAAKAG